MESLGEATSKNLSKSFGDFLFDPFDKGLKGMVSGFIDALKQMVAQAIAQAAVFAALNALTGGALGAANAAGGGGFVGGLAQGLGGTANRAAGGPLQEGQAAVVGERRKPELFIPKQDGTVVPMDQVGGGKAPNVEVPVNITNVTDPEAMTAAMESSQGTQAILNVINSNPEAIKRALS
jgi:phage-related minor tail protein